MEQKLTTRTKVSFGICDLGGNLFFSMIGFHLLFFLTDVVGLVPALAGIAIAAGRVWDAVTDPLVGYISDNTTTRWGRRRPFMFVGAFLLFAGMIAMFTDPGLEQQVPLFIWAVITYVLLNTFYTMVSIPYSSLTPELTSNYEERTVLNGYRHTFAVLGTMLGGAAYPLIVGLFGGAQGGWTATATL
ncbi:MAG: MFS transporter, partial [Spirochaetia bacterium]